MTTKKSALDDYKMEYEDLEQKKFNIRQKAVKKTEKKAQKPKKQHRANPIKLFFGYWAEVVLS